MTTTASELLTKAQAARAASRQLRTLSREAKDRALHAVADSLERAEAQLLEANAQDMAAGKEAGLSAALLARLELTPKGLTAMAGGARNIAALPDPVGEVIDQRTLPNGIDLTRRRVPLGVIGAIFEARPEVPIDISSLCLKSGNAVVMRGGKEAVNTNRALGELVRGALEKSGITSEAVQVVHSTDRALVREMVKLDQYIDLLIPRGGAKLIRFVAQEATMPAITGGIGVCHTYVDASADPAMAREIVFNAKVQAPAKCNALDTLLVHAAAGPKLLPELAVRLGAAGVELRCDRRAMSLLGPSSGARVVEATAQDWGQEFLDLVLAVRMVGSLDEAIEHIEDYGSGHSEAIVTEDQAAGTRFLDEVDAAAVFVNASTRFTDGGQFGLGAEVAISTGKLHARGPMGLQELTSYKWVARGSGQVRP